MTKRALIYARVSYDDRKNESRNLQGQVEDGRAYCQEKGYHIIKELAEDDRGASGASWNLPALNEALDLAKQGGCDVLVTRELDRFARSLAKQLVIEGEFKRYGVDVEYILAEYDDTPEGRLNKHIRAVIAEFEKEKINQRMTRGRRNVVKNGKVMLHGNRPPYGYYLEDGMLVACEEEARVVRLIFTWYVCGDEQGEKLSAKAIARRLTEMEVLTYADTRPKQAYKKTQGRGEWHEGTVRKVLANETYTGVWHCGKRVHGRKLNPREQWLPVEIPAIISRGVWEKVQERKRRNKEMAKRNTKHEYLVGRRVVCGQCGAKMIGNAGNRDRHYYYCPASQGELAAKRACDNRYFRVDKVDAAVWEWVHGLLLEPETLRKKLEEERAKAEEATKPLRARLAVIDDLLADNRRQLEKLLDLYLSNGAFTKEMLTDRKARLEATIAALEKERADLTTQLEAITLTDEQIQDFEEFAIQTMLDLAARQFGDFERRRKIIDDLDVRVTLAMEDGQRVAYVRCRIGEAAIPIDRPSTRSWAL